MKDSLSTKNSWNWVLDYNEAFSKLRSVEVCQSLKVEVWLSYRSGWVEGAYCVEDTYQGKVEVSGYVEDQRCVTA